MEKHSEKFYELAMSFDEAIASYKALVKGAEASHMMLEQYADPKDLSDIAEKLNYILREAKDRLSDYDEYNEITRAAVKLLDSVESAIYLSRYVSQK